MGFLDHSTNNIIIDAVLTDKGRELLAKNNGSFQVVHYAFGDDEVDYTLIRKFGRTVGKEKIEKNTPVFEAQTSSTLALKYPLSTLSNPNLVALPTLVLGSTLQQIQATTNLTVTVNQTSTSTALTNEQRASLGESNYRISLDSRFLTLTNSTSFRRVPNSNIVIYDKSAASQGQGDILSSVEFTLSQVATGGNLTQFHTDTTQKTVKTIVSIQGVSTGASVNIEVTVKYT